MRVAPGKPGGVGSDHGRRGGVRALRARGERLRRGTRSVERVERVRGRRSYSPSSRRPRLLVAGAADHDLILLDRRPRRAGGRPSTRRRSDRPARRDRATGRSPPRRGRTSPRAASPCGGCRAGRRAGRAVAWPEPCRPRSSSSSSSSSLPRPLGLGGFELGGDQRVVLGSQIDLVVEVDVRAGGLRSASGSRPCSRLNAWICCTVTSSWWAIHASVRPWRTQPRIRLSSGRSDLRAILRSETITGDRLSRGRLRALCTDRCRPVCWTRADRPSWTESAGCLVEHQASREAHPQCWY